jgi:hypothetical protein
MFRNFFKIAMAVLFLLLLGVPLAFYRFGYRGAVRETVLVFLLFAVAALFGHWWMKQLRISDSQPTSLDDRILIGLAITSVYLVLGYGFLLGFNTGVILNGLQTSILAGLFGSRLDLGDGADGNVTFGKCQNTCRSWPLYPPLVP